MGGVAQLQINLKTGRQDCVDCLGVSTSHTAFEMSRLNDELLQDGYK